MTSRSADFVLFVKINPIQGIGGEGVIKSKRNSNSDKKSDKIGGKDAR